MTITFTRDPIRRLPADVVADRDFSEMAAQCGIAESATALVLAGKLTRLQVGHRTCYTWRELLPLVTTYPPTLNVRPDLASVTHSITVEVLDAEMARRMSMRRLEGRLVIVERSAGRLGKIMTADQEPWKAKAEALGTARVYGASYVPVGGAR